MGEMRLYRLLGHGAVTLLELLSVGRVKSPEDGPGMTLVGHAGATGRVVALLLRGSADPLSNGGGRGGRASRFACPRQRGTRRDRTLRGGPRRRSRQRSSAHPGRTRRGSRGARGSLTLLDGLWPSSRYAPRDA